MSENKETLLAAQNYNENGLLAHQKGDKRQALELLRKAVETNPDSPVFYSNLGKVLADCEELDNAIKVLLTAMEKFGDSARYSTELSEIHRQLAELYMESGRKESSLKHAHSDLANLYIDKDCLESAFRHFRQATLLHPDNALRHHDLGIAHIKRGDLQEGVKSLMEAIRLKPDYAEALNTLGGIFHVTGDLARARNCYQRAIEVRPDLPESCSNLGNLLLDAGMTGPAITYLQKALQINPGQAEANVYLGAAMLDKQDYPRAEEYYRRGTQLRPDDVSLYGYWTNALLLRGYYAEGWTEHERGLALGTRMITSIPAPYWDGTTPLAEQKIHVLAEQGVGDQIMFLSCLPDLLEKAKPGACLLECDARLVSLYKRSFPGVHFHGQAGNPGSPPDEYSADLKVAIGSLPHIYRRRPEDFPDRSSYLVADPNRVAHWKERYRSLGANRVVGISWRGGHLPQQQRQRSTTLTQWEQVLHSRDTAFVNLQYGDCSKELEAINAGKTLVHDWQDADPLSDLDDFAAQVAALDLVISIDNSTVHMAGAVGTQVWTLLPFVPEWRWMRNREDTPWYKTMTLYRQAKPGDWESVFQRIARALA